LWNSRGTGIGNSFYPVEYPRGHHRTGVLPATRCRHTLDAADRGLISVTIWQFMLSTSHVKHLPVIDETALPFNERFFLPQIVHCRFLATGLHSRYGCSGGCQSWSCRLHCMPGACRGLEQLPHCSLSPESSDPKRTTGVGVDALSATWKPKP
jgi:hypothetical protein